MLNFWNLSKRLRPKIWPIEGQIFSKSKKFKILNEDKKNYNKDKHFLPKQTKNYFTRLFFCFEGHLSQKIQQTNERSNFLFVLAKSGYFVIIFLILI
jgi:hypothetical protein